MSINIAAVSYATAALEFMFLGVSLTSALKWVERRIAPWSHANR